MSKSFDELLKLLEEKKTLTKDDVEKITKEHGDLTDEEKKKLAARAREFEAQEKKEEKKEEEKKEDKEETKEVSMDEYLQALAVMDSDDESEEAKTKAKKIIEAFEANM